MKLFTPCLSSVCEIGDIYGRYQVQGVFKKNGTYRKYALVQCSCGSPQRMVAVDLLRAGSSKSCGCLHKEIITKHGDWNKPIHRCWFAMMSRCYKPSDKRYSRYGGRGITVCDRWHDYQNFLADMASTHEDGLTIDRIDNDGNYEPSNCRWATKKVQNRNYSRNIVISHDGKTQCLMEWAEETGICYGTLWDRYKAGWSIEKLLTTLP